MIQVRYEPELLAYMKEKGRKNISVEVASSHASDFEVTEIFLRFVRDSQADYLCRKQRYRSIQTEIGRVLLPPYRLEYDDTITFGLKKYWIFRHVTFDGIRL
ncbi:MAG: hypothetical protein IKE58_05950 [Blautia sp.]|nr:hypothetical protein [Blautia sp.]